MTMEFGSNLTYISMRKLADQPLNINQLEEIKEENFEETKGPLNNTPKRRNSTVLIQDSSLDKQPLVEDSNINQEILFKDQINKTSQNISSFTNIDGVQLAPNEINNIEISNNPLLHGNLIPSFKPSNPFISNNPFNHIFTPNLIHASQQIIPLSTNVNPNDLNFAYKDKMNNSTYNSNFFVNNSKNPNQPIYTKHISVPSYPIEPFNPIMTSIKHSNVVNTFAQINPQIIQDQIHNLPLNLEQNSNVQHNLSQSFVSCHNSIENNPIIQNSIQSYYNSPKELSTGNLFNSPFKNQYGDENQLMFLTPEKMQTNGQIINRNYEQINPQFNILLNNGNMSNPNNNLSKNMNPFYSGKTILNPPSIAYNQSINHLSNQNQFIINQANPQQKVFQNTTNQYYQNIDSKYYGLTPNNFPKKNIPRIDQMGYVPSPRSPCINRIMMDNNLIEKANNISLSNIGLTPKVHVQELDDNIISIGLNDLKEKLNINTGERNCCLNCNASLNIYSKNIFKTQNPNKWICEFCNFQNEIMIDEEEFPKSEINTYIIKSKMQLRKDSKEENEQSIIFCIDTSGSMGVSQPIKGKFQFKYDKNVELQKYNTTFGDGSYQNLQSENYDITYVTRMQCVQIAIESQIANLSKNFQNKKIGLVAFGNDVLIIGDGIQSPKTIAGDKLNNYNQIYEESSIDSEAYLSTKISESKNFLLNKLSSIEEGGQTALGPGLLASLGLLSRSNPGSKIIICTDGLSNIGIGSLENAKLEESKLIYNEIGNVAKQKGIIISIISISDIDCNLDLLRLLAEITGGDIIKVNALNLNEDFAEILLQNLVASEVEIHVKLHKSLKFINEENKDISPDQSLLKKYIGNVVENQSITFRYSVKPLIELKKNEIELKKINSFPFQAQIFYTSLEGDKCVRYITKIQKYTYNFEESRVGQNDQVFCNHSIEETIKLVKKGDYRSAQARITLSPVFLTPQSQRAFNYATQPLYTHLQIEQYNNAINPSPNLEPLHNQNKVPFYSNAPSDKLVAVMRDLEKRK